MTTVERSVSVDAAPEAVWQVLAAYDRIAEWAPDVAHSCLLSDQTVGVGTVRRVQVGRNALRETVVRWDPGTALGYTIEGLPSLVRSAANTWTLEAGGGRTAITITSAIDSGPRPPGRLVGRAVARAMAGASERMLAGLTDHLAAHLDDEPAG